MNNYFILKEERLNLKFDAHIQGILLNDKYEIIPNPFNKLISLNSDCKYFIKASEKGSESGKLRDKLSVRIQNQESLFVTNSKITRLFLDMSEHIFFHDLTILQNNNIIDTYKVANIIKSIICINYTESKLIFWEQSHETIYNIDKLVLEESMIPPELNIFLLGSIRGSVIIIHRRLKEIIEQAKITGFNFCEIKDFVM